MHLSALADAFVWSDACAGASMRLCVDSIPVLHVSDVAAPPGRLFVVFSATSNVPVVQTITDREINAKLVNVIYLNGGLRIEM